MRQHQPTFSVILHGSFSKHYAEILRTHVLFRSAGVEVLAPQYSDISTVRKDFLLLEGEEQLDPRLVELQYLQHLRKLGASGFSYFVNPDGYLGKSASYELGIAQLCNVAVFFSHKPKDLPVYYSKSAIIAPEELIAYVTQHHSLPQPSIARNERVMHNLFHKLLDVRPQVAVGGIIEYQPTRTKRLPEVLFVKTHKWGGRYSIVGGKLQPQESLIHGLKREIYEEIHLKAEVSDHICTFDQIKNSGYFVPEVNHIFVDYVARVSSKRVVLNEEAQDYVWMPAEQALAELPIEPNAVFTLERYVAAQ